MNTRRLLNALGLGVAGLLSAAAALAAPPPGTINITISRTSDTLATISVNTGSALTSAEGFYLWVPQTTWTVVAGAAAALVPVQSLA